MNAEIIGYKLPLWQVIAIATECALGAVLAGTGVFVFVRAAKLRRREDTEPTQVG